MSAQRAMRKVTFSLPAELVERLLRLAEENRIPSVNSGVRDALEGYIARLEREEFGREMEAAGQDPEFVKDLDDTMAAFSEADRQSGRTMP